MQFTRTPLLVLALVASLGFATPAFADTGVSGNITSDTTWTKVDSPYLVSDPVGIPAGVTLTIEPGVVVKMGQSSCNCYSNFGITGRVIAGSASSTERVIFTSIADDSVGGDSNGDGASTTPAAGDWRMIAVTGGVLELHHADVKYGGLAVRPFTFFNPDAYRMIENEGGTVVFDDADISFAYNNSSYRQLFSGTTTVMDSRFHDSPIATEFYSGGFATFTNTAFSSTSFGIYSHGGAISVASSTFTGSIYGVYNLSPEQIDARNNYWGSPTGPTNPANPTGTGAAVQGNVLFDPWLKDECTQDCYSNVMFLPGVEGSRLYDSTGERRWLSENDSEADYVRMNNDGTSALPDIATKDAIDTADLQQLYTDIYKSFLLEMKTWEHDYHITATTTPYDWRLDYDTVVNNGRKLPNGQISYLVSPEAGHDPYLLETLKQLAATSKTGKVTIVGHSQGGLIAKALMQKIGPAATAQYIDKVILVASPQIGTPQAVATLLHGSGGGIFGAISDSKARELAQNFPSGYGLLPSSNYFTHVDGSVVDIDQTTLPDWAAKYATTTHSTERMGNFMLDETRMKPSLSDLATPEVANASLFTRAQTAHATLDSWTPPAGVHLITVAGWGEETLSGIQYRGVKDCVKTAQVIIQGAINTYCAEYQIKPSLNPKKVIDGDGTVVEPSAMWANGASSTRYWVNLDRYNFLIPDKFATKHADIFEASPLLTLIQNILVGTSTQIDLISTSSPRDKQNRERLHFTLHSPLTLGFIDTIGNYTGSTATSSEFNIPDVTYERYGDVQWLSAPRTLTGQLVLHGVASGSFTLDVEEVNGNDTISATSFEGIPSSTSTIVTMLINPLISSTASSTLVVDEDGNGAPDITLQAAQNSVVLLPIPSDLTPPITAASATGSLGTNGWYTSNVLVTLTATDTGTGVATTSYSLNGGATWTQYSAPISVVSEGTTSILHYSIDKTGNSEATNTLMLKIDKTAPEAAISVSTGAQDILVEGTDNFGSTTVTKDSSGNVTVTDQAGHTTKLSFTKTYSGKQLTYARLTGVQYDAQPKGILPSSSFLYIWETKAPVALLSQTIAVDNTYLIQATFDKSKNKTTIIVLKKNLPIQTQVLAGLKIVKLTTSRGVIGYGW